jgi:hypothetical protein
LYFKKTEHGRIPPRECSTTPEFEIFANSLHADLRPREKALVFIKHDESTFSANDGKRQIWMEKGKNPLRPKSRGKGIMVSVFLIPGGILRVLDRIRDAELLADPTWPRLKDGKPVREAVEYLEYGKDNYWTREKLMKLVMEAALSIFKMVFNSKKSQRVLAFDNAANHCAYKLDALLTSRMSLSPGGKQALLREGFDYDCGLPHTMVFPGNYPNRKLHGKAKGLQQVFTEHDLWPYKSKRSDGMKFLLLCPTSFGRPGCHLLEEMPQTACCATKVISLQQDFKKQQGWVEEAPEAEH